MYTLEIYMRVGVYVYVYISQPSAGVGKLARAGLEQREQGLGRVCAARLDRPREPRVAARGGPLFARKRQEPCGGGGRRQARAPFPLSLSHSHSHSRLPVHLRNLSLSLSPFLSLSLPLSRSHSRLPVHPSSLTGVRDFLVGGLLVLGDASLR